MLGTLTIVSAALIVVFFVTGFPLVTDYSQLQSRDIWPDVLHERAVAWEALHGDPTRSMSEIMPEHGYPEMVGGVSPRTPAALLAQTALLLIPDGALMPVVSLTIMALAILVLWLTHRVVEVGWGRLVWAGPLLMVSFPVITALVYGSVSVMATVVLVLSAWASRDREWAGVPLGLATALRLWPGLVILGFWIAGRRRAARLALVLFLGANLLGLLLPGVTLEGSIQVLSQGGGDWISHNQNASLALVLSRFEISPLVAIVLGSLVAIALAARRPGAAIGICVVAAILASPLSWPTYLLAALPLLTVWAREQSYVVVAALYSPLVLWTFLPLNWKGQFGFLILLTLLAYAYLGPQSKERVLVVADGTAVT